MSYLPPQKIANSEKTRDWGINTMRYFIDQSGLEFTRNEEFKSLYRAYEGLIDEEYYRYILNPYNSEESEVRRNLPAKLRSINILKPVIDSIVEERANEPDVTQVVSTNPEVVNEQKFTLNAVISKQLQQDVINNLNALGFDTKLDSKQLPPYADLVEQTKTTFQSKRTIRGSQALDYLEYDTELRDKSLDMFLDYLLTGRTISYKEVYRNNVSYNRIDPEEIWASLAPNDRFIEDGNAVVRRYRTTLANILDRFRSDLTDDEIDELEARQKHVIGTNVGGTFYTNRDNPIFLDDFENVFHITWKSFRKVKILHYMGVMGIEQMEVDETYKLDKAKGDIKIEVEWKNEVLQGWRIGEDIYPLKDKGFERLNVQRQEVNNSSSCKLPYNGIITKTKSGEIMSLMKDGMPYQALYNVYNFRVEAMLGINKNKLMLMPLGLRPPKWKLDQWLYHADATGITWFDETHPKIQQILQGLKAIDLSLGNYIVDMVKLLEFIRSEWWDVSGFNRQRMGQTMASDGKAVTQEALYRSGLLTAKYGRKFDKLMERDKQGLIDCSKLAWIDGKKGGYVSSSLGNAILDIQGQDHLETDYDVFVKLTQKEKGKLQMYKELLQPLVQNGMNSKVLAEIIDSDNMENIKHIVERATNIEQRFQAEQAEAERQAEVEAAEAEKQQQDSKNNTDIQVAEIRREAAIRVAEINASAREGGMDEDKDNDGIDDENGLNEREMVRKEKETDAKIRQGDEELQIKRKQANQKTTAK